MHIISWTRIVPSICVSSQRRQILNHISAYAHMHMHIHRHPRKRSCSYLQQQLPSMHDCYQQRQTHMCMHISTHILLGTFRTFHNFSTCINTHHTYSCRFVHTQTETHTFPSHTATFLRSNLSLSLSLSLFVQRQVHCLSIHTYSRTHKPRSYVPPPPAPSTSPPSPQPTDDGSAQPNTYSSTPNEPSTTTSITTTPTPAEAVAPSSSIWTTGVVAGVSLGATGAVLLAMVSAYIFITRRTRARLAKNADPFSNIMAAQQSQAAAHALPLPLSAVGAGDTAATAHRPEAHLKSLELQGFSKVGAIADMPPAAAALPNLLKREPTIGPMLGFGAIQYNNDSDDSPEATTRAASVSAAGVTGVAEVSLVFEDVRGSGVIRPYAPSELPAIMPQAAVMASLEYYEPSVSVFVPGMLMSTSSQDDDDT